MNARTLKLVVVVVCVLAAAWGVTVRGGHNHSREGEIVVAGGNFLVDSESRLRAALPGITATGRIP